MFEKVNDMEQYQCIVVDLAYYDNQKRIIVSVNDDVIEISAEIDGVTFSALGEYYFETYQSFRDKLLDMGYGLKCNGSRINAVQSGMMGYCPKIYLVEMGKQALRSDIVNIWEYADISYFPNSKEQSEYSEKWYESI